MSFYMSLLERNSDFVAYEQQSCRPAHASAQFDQGMKAEYLNMLQANISLFKLVSVAEMVDLSLTWSEDFSHRGPYD